MTRPLLSVGRLTGKAIALGLGRMATVGAQFAVNLLLVRWWTPELFGTFHELRVFVSAALLLELGLGTGLLHAPATGSDEDRDRVFGAGVSLAYGLGLLCAAGFSIASLFSGTPSLAHALPFAGWLVAANIPAAVIESVLVVRDRHRSASVVSMITALLGLALTGVVLVTHPTIAAVYGALAIAGTVRLLAYHSMSGVGLPQLRSHGTHLLALVRLSLGVSASRMLGMVSGWMDRVVVMTFFSAASLGVYVAGAWEVPFMAIFFGAITSAIVPEMSDHWRQGRQGDAFSVWTGAVARSAWVVFPLATWAWVWSPEIIRVLFTDAYTDAVPVFRVYLGMMPLRVAVYSALFVGIGDVRALVTGAALDVVVNVVMSVILAQTIGLAGPAAATVLATWVQVTYYLVYVSRRYAVSLTQLLPWRSLAVAAAVSAGCIVPSMLLRGVDVAPVVQLVAALCVVGVVMVGGIYITTDSIRIGGIRRDG